MKTIIFFLIILFPRVLFGMDSKVANSPIANLVDSRHFSETEYSTIALAPTETGTNYYVDGTNGSDTYDGLYATHTTGNHGPFKTITKGVGAWAERAYGDRVLIKAGTYKEYHINPAGITGTPSENNRFMVGAYGDGEVIIDGSETVTWSVYSGNIYQCTLGSGVTTESIVMDDNYKSCWPVASLVAVTQDGYWYQSGTTLYLYCSSGTPSSRNAMVRRTDEYHDFEIVTSSANYLTFYGLTIVSAPSEGFAPTGNYLRIEKCKVKFCGRAGISVGWLVEGTEVYKCYVYGNVMCNWPRGRYNGGGGGWPCGFQQFNGNISGCIIGHNGGEGLGVRMSATPMTIEDNISYDNWSVNIYPDSTSNITIRRNIVLCSEFNLNELWDYPAGPGDWYQEARRLRPLGIAIGEEYGLSSYIDIYDNLIIACKQGIGLNAETSGVGWNNSNIYSNTIILPNADPSAWSDTYYGIRVGTNTYNTATFFKNNVIIGTDSHGYVAHKGTDNGTTWNNNIYYHPNNSTPFEINEWPNNVVYNFADWKTNSSQDANSLNIDPKLTYSNWSDVSALNVNDFVLLSNSPAIDVAANLENTYATDYNSIARPQGNGWDMGALEYGGVAAPLPADTVAPSVPTSIGSNNITQTSVDLSWSVSTDNVGVSGYKVYRNGVQIGTSPTTSYSDSGLSAATTYQYTVSAFDAAGNESAKSASIQVTTLPVTYSLNTAAINGSVTRDPDLVSYTQGASVTLTAVPNTGYQFSGWSGDITGTTNPVSIAMNSNKTITADFALKTYTIIASAGTGGLITPSGSISVTYGQNQAFSISANTGYKISDVLVDAVSVGAVSSYTFTNVTGPHSITANLTLIPPPTLPAAPTNLTPTALSGGTIKLTWSDNSNNENGFSIEYSTNGIYFKQIATVAANTTTYSKSGYNRAGTYYRFRVRAYNQAGYSVYSNTVSAYSNTFMVKALH